MASQPEPIVPIRSATPMTASSHAAETIGIPMSPQ
jgi:hypothetical protein